ncbi:MAG: homoserine dehydrogenase [Candidatus Bathyarchaeia archaeon]
MRLTLIGFGTVGQSLIKLLANKKDELTKKFGLNPKFVAIVDTGGAAIDENGINPSKAIEVKKSRKSVAFMDRIGYPGMSATDVIKNVEAEVVIEMTPTNFSNGEPGLSHIKTAISSKRHVITTNKGPLALALPSLMELASYNRVKLRFSGTVGGGTPILDFAKKSLLGDRIISIKGILNGTTNYILTRMFEASISMDQALKEAQKAGYAEADPSYDIEGIDTACKLVIIANWIMNLRISLKDVNIKGINEVTLKDVEKAREEGRVIKLIGSIEKKARVRPELIPQNHPLAVHGTLNAVTYKTETCGEITLVGRGAGGPETASAILRDIVDIKMALVK